MSLIMNSAQAQALKATLEAIVTDKPSNDVDFTKWCEVTKMSDAYMDWMEWGPPGLASEKTEGGDVPMGTMQAGAFYRAWARTWGLGLAITEEAIEDNKYPEILKAGRMLTSSVWRTADIDATNMISRGFNTAYTGGDGVALFSASHPLPRGGTFSNVMATPMTPSRAAVITMTTQLGNMPGHDGLLRGYEPVKILHPRAQWAIWSELINSVYAPETGEFNRINVVNTDLRLSSMTLRWWQNTDTQWCVQTDCDEKPRFGWRRRPRSSTYVGNSNEVMYYKVTARWARLWVDPRCLYGVEVS